jgi:hypothetical protein
LFVRAVTGRRSPFIQDLAEIWREGDKVVYSKTLETVSSELTSVP